MMVVRRARKNGQGPLVPFHTVILVLRDDLPVGELGLRHYGKQGQVVDRSAVHGTELTKPLAGPRWAIVCVGDCGWAIVG